MWQEVNTGWGCDDLMDQWKEPSEHKDTELGHDPAARGCDVWRGKWPDIPENPVTPQCSRVSAPVGNRQETQVRHVTSQTLDTDSGNGWLRSPSGFWSPSPAGSETWTGSSCWCIWRPPPTRVSDNKYEIMKTNPVRVERAERPGSTTATSH